MNQKLNLFLIYLYQRLRYTCPGGKMFETGEFPFWFNKCLPSKQWTHPQKLPDCMRKFLNDEKLTIFLLLNAYPSIGLSE